MAMTKSEKYNAQPLLRLFEEGIANAITESYLRYLSAAAAAFNQSYTNTYLVLRHMPEATLVADEPTWLNAYGRRVTVKRSEGIPAVVPSILWFDECKTKDDRLVLVEGPHGWAPGTVRRYMPYLKRDVLYDISMTEGREFMRRPPSSDPLWEAKVGRVAESMCPGIGRDLSRDSVAYATAIAFGIEPPDGEFAVKAALLAEMIDLQDLRGFLNGVQNALCHVVRSVNRALSFDIKAPSPERGLEWSF